MNKNKLTLTIGGAIATVFAMAPIAHAESNPFAMQKIIGAQVLAQADQKMNEGGCSGSKMQEGKCGEGKFGASKMQEGGCSGSIKQ